MAIRLGQKRALNAHRSFLKKEIERLDLEISRLDVEGLKDKIEEGAPAVHIW